MSLQHLQHLQGSGGGHGGQGVTIPRHARVEYHREMGGGHAVVMGGGVGFGVERERGAEADMHTHTTHTQTHIHTHTHTHTSKKNASPPVHTFTLITARTPRTLAVIPHLAPPHTQPDALHRHLHIPPTYTLTRLYSSTGQGGGGGGGRRRVHTPDRDRNRERACFRKKDDERPHTHLIRSHLCLTNLANLEVAGGTSLLKSGNNSIGSVKPVLFARLSQPKFFVGGLQTT
jgi:hypothetical protein